MSLQTVKDQIGNIQELRIAATYAIESLERIERLLQSDLAPEAALAFTNAEYTECSLALKRVRHIALKIEG